MKKTTENETPATVATDFVARFTSAVESSTKNTERRPIGISIPAMVTFGGTFQPRSPLYLKRRTSMDKLLKVKLQITPNAYASPRTYTSPRLARMVRICNPTTRLMMRELVPYLRWGKRNQSASTPSSETRLRTPLDPMIAVLTAPERMRNPTTTTNARKIRRRMRGPHMYIARPEMRLSL